MRAGPSPLLSPAAGQAEDGEWVGPLPPGRALLRRLRAVCRLALVLALTLLAAPVQALLLALPGPGKRHFPRLYWRAVCRCIGVQVLCTGACAEPGVAGRGVLYVANHTSWLDIPVLGSVLPAGFVAKREIRGWPLIATIARLGRTVFVGRQRHSLRGEIAAMRTRLDRGDGLVLFPEGTSSDGSRVLPFYSAFLALALQPKGGKAPLLQPVSVAYDRLAGLPAGRGTRPLFAWYGSMALAPHCWRLLQQRSLRASVLLHEAFDPTRLADRKHLVAAVWQTVASGAATLRQNRPPVPLASAPPLSPPP